MSNTEMKKDMSCDTTCLYSKENQPTLGKYGRMRRTFLQEHCKTQYNLMLMNDTLWPHLLEVERQVNEMMDTIVDRMKRERGITEQLKANDQWRWIQEMGNIRNAAEEFVLLEVVFA